MGFSNAQLWKYLNSKITQAISGATILCDGDVEVTKTDPTITLTDNDYAEIKRTSSSNLFTEKNRTLSVGGIGSGIESDTATDYVEFAYDAANAVGTDDMSVSFWFKYAALSPGTSVYYICGQNTSGATGWRVYVTKTDYVTFYVYDGSAVQFLAYLTPIPDTNWHQYTITYDRDGNMSLYRDNVLSRAAAKTGAQNTFDVGQPIRFFKNLMISGEAAQGIIDEFAMYNKVLDATERDREWSSGIGYYHTGTEDNLIFACNFDDNLTDITTSNTGTNNGTTYETGKVIAAGSMKLIDVIKSYNGVDSGEYGIVELSDDHVQTIINGKTLEFKLNSSLAAQLEADGTFSVDTANYEDLILDDNDIPNRLFTMNNISAPTLSTTRLINTDSPYTVLSTDNNILCDTDAGAITVNLPAGVDGSTYRIINTGSSGNDVTLTPDGSELLNGVNASETIYDSEKFIITYETTEGWW